MRKPASLPGFPEYLREAIGIRGYRTPTDFARAAGIHPSVVLRWLAGDIRPTIPLLERAAPILGAKLSTLIRIAYPEVDAGLPIDSGGEDLHPLAAELNRYLSARSHLTDDERELLRRVQDYILSRHRSSPRPKAEH